MTATGTTTPHNAARRELAYRVLARRRLLPFIEKINPRYQAGWVHEDICRRLEEFSEDVEAGKSPRLMLLMPPRHGKLLADDTWVPTPSGWVRHGDLAPGDYVFGPDGQPTQVLAVSPTAPADVRVQLSNGEVFYCHERHEWEVIDRSRRKTVVRETQWLMNGARGPRQLVSGGRHTYQLREAAALQYGCALPDGFPAPYALGAWLGDGSCGKPCITHTSAKLPVIEKMVALGYEVSTVVTHATTGVDTTYFSGPRPGCAGRLTRELQASGVYHDKHIPEAYQRLSIPQRYELLAGLIDTDGHVDGRSRVVFSTVREALARQVMELCEGLGLRPYLQVAQPKLSSSGIQGRQEVWVVGFQPTAPLPTVVAHKRVTRLAPQRHVAFADVRHDPQGKVGRCIQVDRDDGLYVVGRKLTVTHNSEIASRMFPAWHLGRYPDHEFIACSYNVSLAMSFSRKVKEVINDPAYEAIFDTRLHPDFQAAEEWAIKGHRGGYVAAGVGGGITGKGAHCLLIDDPIKNAEEAQSADLREKLWEWYTSTAYTRLAPGGGVLVIQTWWHDDDLAGKLQNMMKDDPEADQFEVIRYPAIAEADEWLDTHTGEIIRPEPDGVFIPEPHVQQLRLKGEALHAARYDLGRLNQIRKTLPVQWWSALYQQNPVPDEGVYFTKDMFRRGPAPRLEDCYVNIAFDFAISEKSQNDYTVGTVTLLDSDDMLHFVDRVRFKSADADFIVKSIVHLCKKWHNPSIQLGLEDGQIYRALSAPLKREMARQRVYPSMQLLKPITDKQARARTLQGRMQQGLVSFSDKADWYDQMRTEMLRFPNGVHDDQVDSAAWNAIMAAGRQPPRKQQVNRVKSWKDRLEGAGTATHMAA